MPHECEQIETIQEMEKDFLSMTNEVSSRLDGHGKGIKIIGEQFMELKNAFFEFKSDLKTLLWGVGTEDGKGLVAKVSENTEERTKRTASKNGFLDWAFRLLVVIALGLIGLKP